MNQKGNTYIIYTLIVALFIIVIVYFNYSNKNFEIPTNRDVQNTTSLNTNKEYKSKPMGITFNIPDKFNILDQLTRIIITNQDGQQIIIFREGTQFDDLESYLNDRDKKNKTKVVSERNLEIDNYPTKARTVKSPGKESQDTYSYEIFINPRVYSLSTSSKELYNDLDQIAKSFRYTP